MCRFLFNRKFYFCLYRAYVESAKRNCTTTNFRPALLWTLVYILLFLIMPSGIVYYLYNHAASAKSMAIPAAFSFLLFSLVAFCLRTIGSLLIGAKKLLNAMDTIETFSSSDASDNESAIAASQSEQFMNWFYKGPHLEPWPHSRIPQSDDCEALRSLRHTNQKSRRNYEKLCSQQSPDSAVSETSFIESAQESYDESNLLLQAEHRSLNPSRSSEEHTKVTLRSRHPSESLKEHTGLTLRSRHPSGSLEEHTGLTQSLNPSISSEEQATSSTFVTVAEVHRSNYEESD
nr:uncharacterized protein LOC107451771 isoform X1 [Parasteatoda tepidariorum]